MSEEQVKLWVRQELRRIIDLGLFYSTEVNKAATENKPVAPAPQTEKKHDLNAINWGEPIPREGKDPFYKATVQANQHNPEFASLKEWLKTKDGFNAFLGPNFLKLFDDGNIGKFPTHQKFNGGLPR